MSDTPQNADGQPNGQHKRTFALPPAAERLDDDVREELQFHIDERIEQFVADGMTREEAEREVAKRFGDYEEHRIETRRIDEDTLHIRRRTERLYHLKREIGLALRSLRKSPGFTVVAFVTLVIGIAAATGIFSILDAVVLRPDVPQQQRARLRVAPGHASPAVVNACGAYRPADTSSSRKAIARSRASASIATPA